MISRCTCSIPEENLVFPRLLYCDLRRSQTCHRRSQVLPGLSQVLPGLSPVVPIALKVLSGALRHSQSYHNHSHGTPVPVIRDLSYSEGWQECPPRVWYSPEIDASKFTLHILSDTPGVFQWLKYILLMCAHYNEISQCLIVMVLTIPMLDSAEKVENWILGLRFSSKICCLQPPDCGCMCAHSVQRW